MPLGQPVLETITNTYIYRERETGRQRQRETNRQTDRQTNRQTQTDTDRQTETETVRKKGGSVGGLETDRRKEGWLGG